GSDQRADQGSAGSGMCGDPGRARDPGWSAAGSLKRMQPTYIPRSPRPIVIIGAGGIVRDAHLPAYRLAGFPVHGICDLEPERARALAQQFEIDRVFASSEE